MLAEFMLAGIVWLVMRPIGYDTRGRWTNF